MSGPRKLLLLVPALIACAMLSGCVVFVAGSPSPAQRDIIGSVEVTSTICAEDPNQSSHQGCTTSGNSEGTGSEAPDEPLPFQILTGYRVPAGSDGPETFPVDVPANPLTFRRSPTYTAELQRVFPAPAGQRWVGYISDQFTYDANANAAAEANRMTFSPAFTLPRGDGGAPVQGFSFQQVTGARLVDTNSPSTRPVECADNASDLADGGFCFDSPEPGAIAQGSINLQTRDLGILGGGTVPVGKGQSASVSFAARYAGEATPEANFSVAVTTTVPGGTATVNRTAFTPAEDSTTPLSANVRVPGDTPAGTYRVTLTASLPNGQTRSATRQIEVTADTTKPRASASIVKGQSVRSLLKKGLKVKVKMTEPGRVTSELLGSSGFLAANKVLGKKTTRFTKAQTKTVRIKLGKKARRKKARRKLLAKKKIKFVVRNKARDSAGNRRNTTKKLTLKRGK